MTFPDSSDDRQQERQASITELWRSADVATFLDISEATLSRWRKRGVGPGCIHIAGVARYRPETVSAWIESMERRDGATGSQP